MALRTKAHGAEAEYRRLKRLELAKRVRIDLWARSPSPPREEEEAKGKEEEAPAAEEVEREDAPAPASDTESTSESVSDQEEAEEEVRRFKHFLQELERRRAEAIAEQERIEEESRFVGPEAPEEKAYAGPGSYGKNLLPGEGDAMAAYVQSGQRIPRRGEVGLTSEQIQNYEDLGYVMSGSRHSRMNAIRIRKENQVYSAEEKAALAMINFEEKKAKEQEVMKSMQALVKQHLQQSEDDKD